MAGGLGLLDLEAKHARVIGSLIVIGVVESDFGEEVFLFAVAPGEAEEEFAAVFGPIEPDVFRVFFDLLVERWAEGRWEDLADFVGAVARIGTVFGESFPDPDGIDEFVVSIF